MPERQGRAVSAQRVAERVQGPVGGHSMQPDLAAQQTALVKIAQREIGVGHGCPLAALAVAGRAWRSAGALGTDPQAGALGPGDRSAARTDRFDRDHGLA